MYCTFAIRLPYPDIKEPHDQLVQYILLGLLKQYNQLKTFQFT